MLAGVSDNWLRVLQVICALQCALVITKVNTVCLRRAHNLILYDYILRTYQKINTYLNQLVRFIHA